ncbi:MAG: sugar transferase [Chitinophagaceae bacterium]|nr:sugar transferase [Chitinophagaceae bacterium]
MDGIRFFDLFFAIVGLILLSPLFLILALCIKVSSKGPVFFKQDRVGKNGQIFKLYKFRSMYVNAEAKGQLTVGGNDSRINPVGLLLRKYKLDELPQFINVLTGDMSFVGPRPEVKKYVDLYTSEQLKVLNVLPGITDYASLEYRNENELLLQAKNPEKFYIDEIMPRKIELNYKFIDNRNFKNYFSILFLTIWTSIKGK